MAINIHEGEVPRPGQGPEQQRPSVAYGDPQSAFRDSGKQVAARTDGGSPLRILAVYEVSPVVPITTPGVAERPFVDVRLQPSREVNRYRGPDTFVDHMEDVRAADPTIDMVDAVGGSRETGKTFVAASVRSVIEPQNPRRVESVNNKDLLAPNPLQAMVFDFKGDAGRKLAADLSRPDPSESPVFVGNVGSLMRKLGGTPGTREAILHALPRPDGTDISFEEGVLEYLDDEFTRTGARNPDNYVRLLAMGVHKFRGTKVNPVDPEHPIKLPAEMEDAFEITEARLPQSLPTDAERPAGATARLAALALHLENVLKVMADTTPAYPGINHTNPNPDNPAVQAVIYAAGTERRPSQVRLERDLLAGAMRYVLVESPYRRPLRVVVPGAEALTPDELHNIRNVVTGKETDAGLPVGGVFLFDPTHPGFKKLLEAGGVGTHPATETVIMAAKGSTAQDLSNMVGVGPRQLYPTGASEALNDEIGNTTSQEASSTTGDGSSTTSKGGNIAATKGHSRNVGVTFTAEERPILPPSVPAALGPNQAVAVEPGTLELIPLTLIEGGPLSVLPYSPLPSDAARIAFQRGAEYFSDKHGQAALEITEGTPQPPSRRNLEAETTTKSRQVVNPVADIERHWQDKIAPYVRGKSRVMFIQAWEAFQRQGGTYPEWREIHKY